MPSKKKHPIDWVAIERDYRAGIKSNLQIAREHKISEGSIRKKAKDYEWQRNLADVIRARALQLVQEQDLRNEVRDEISDSQIVENNAQIQAEVIKSQRKDISSKRKLVEHLANELEDETLNKDAYVSLKEMLANSENADQAKLEEAFRRAISLPSRIDSVKKLSEALKTLIGLEREAFGIDEKEKAPPPPTDIDSVNAKLAELLEKANSQQ